MDANGHVWRIGRFQADDESECSLCGVQGDDPDADKPCPLGKAQSAPDAHNYTALARRINVLRERLSPRQPA